MTDIVSMKAWLVKHGYSTGGGDNVGYLLANFRDQIIRKEADTIHNAAIEAAAKACEARRILAETSGSEDAYNAGVDACAAAIRRLKR